MTEIVKAVTQNNHRKPDNAGYSTAHISSCQVQSGPNLGYQHFNRACCASFAHQDVILGWLGT